VVPEPGLGQRIADRPELVQGLVRQRHARFRSRETAKRFLPAFPELVLADLLERREY
jgi:hypothetical protein